MVAGPRPAKGVDDYGAVIISWVLKIQVVTVVGVLREGVVAR